MNTVITVLTTLGVNQTLWIQLIITVIFLFLAQKIFVRPLLKSLEERQKGTIGADNDAEKLQHHAEVSRKRYEKLLNDKIVELNNEYSTGRKNVKDELEKDYKESESNIMGKFKQEMEVKKNEFEKLKIAVEKESAELAGDLLEKMKS